MTLFDTMDLGPAYLFGFGCSNHACDSNKLQSEATLQVKSDYMDRYQTSLQQLTKLIIIYF